MAQLEHIFLPVALRDNGWSSGHIVGLADGDRCFHLIRIGMFVSFAQVNAANTGDARVYVFRKNLAGHPDLEGTSHVTALQIVERHDPVAMFGINSHIISTGGLAYPDPQPYHYDEQCYGVWGFGMDAGTNWTGLAPVLWLEGVWERPTKSTRTRHALAVYKGTPEPANMSQGMDVHLPR